MSTFLGMLLNKKRKKNNLSKVILKLECLFNQNVYIYYFILFCVRRTILTQTNPKIGLIKKNPPYMVLRSREFKEKIIGNSNFMKTKIALKLADRVVRTFRQLLKKDFSIRIFRNFLRN
jgi:hypothetical protein